MRTRGLIGRRLVGVRQQRARTTSGRHSCDVSALLLEGGVTLVPSVRETEDSGYVVDFLVVRDKRREKRS
jgi:hypothetical protein